MTDQDGDNANHTTERLVLRPLREDDATHFVRLLAEDEETILMTARLPDPCTEEAARQWIRQRTEPNCRSFAILEQSSRAFIGSIGYGGEGGEAMVGYWLAREYQRQGLGTEALRAVVDLARAAGIGSLIADSFVENIASSRILDKAGFTFEGVLYRPFPERGGMRQVRAYRFDLSKPPQSMNPSFMPPVG